MLTADIMDKLNTLNKGLDCAVIYNENVTIMKDGRLEIIYSVRVYANVRAWGFDAPVLISTPNIKEIEETLDKLILKIKEEVKNG